jgi:hypothetical protein
MSCQIFKKHINIDILFNFLDKICLKTTKYYIFNKIAFKKGLFTEDIHTFINDCNPYYHNSKQKYLTKPLTYNGFTTIIRQICNINKTIYTSQIKYEHSSYDIVYYIYF